MNAFNIAGELGKLMAASKEYLRLLDAEKHYMEDENSKEIVKTFRRKQKILDSLEGQKDTTDIKEIRKELMILFDEIQKNKIIKELDDALNEFLILKQDIYKEIEDSIEISDEVLSLKNNCGCNKNCGSCK